MLRHGRADHTLPQHSSGAYGGKPGKVGALVYPPPPILKEFFGLLYSKACEPSLDSAHGGIRPLGMGVVCSGAIIT